MSRRQSTQSGTRLGHFLFYEDTLTDFDLDSGGEKDERFRAIDNWDQFLPLLQTRFKGLPASLTNLADGRIVLEEVGACLPSATLTLDKTGNTTRIELRDETMRSSWDQHMAWLDAHDGKRATAALDKSPVPVWRTDNCGNVVWQNQACSLIADDKGSLPDIANVAKDSGTQRFSVDHGDSGSSWFDITTLNDGDEQLHSAIDTTAVVQAKTAQREFVQTLTKTFANLTTGLAIFDRNRQLALFNPALVDLTNVSATILSGRPDLMQFFDELRERQVLPEPKDYACWRAQIKEAVEKANDGLYQETWTLPAGLTYRVTGRPHPDGAVAFLFEDISAEISVTRRFRAQIDLRQSVLDGLDEAIAVIAPNNLLLFCNRPCNDLLGFDPDTAFADMSLRDLMAICRQHFGWQPAWSNFEAKILSKSDREAHHVTLLSDVGRNLECKVSPLPGGVKMLVFSTQVTASEQSKAGMVS